MKINWKVRLKNPYFIFVNLGIILSTIFTYYNLTGAELTTWASVFELIKNVIQNPYLLVLIGLALLGTAIDPTTKGISDSIQALKYTEPKE